MPTPLATRRRVEALLAFNGWGHARDSGDDASLGVDAALSSGDHRFYTEILAQMMFNFEDAERSGQIAEEFRRSSSPEVFRSVNADVYEWDVRPLLSTVRCPVLVVQNEMGFPARDAGQRLASALPLGRLTRLTGMVRPSAADVLAFFCEVTPGSQPGPESDLSPREVEVLRLLSDGLANKQIALQLGISLNTVLRHVSRVFDKTGARNRVEAAAAARKLGLLR